MTSVRSAPCRRLQIPFGHGSVAMEVPETNLLAVVEPVAVAATGSATAIVAAALANPIGTPRLRYLVHPRKRVAVVTSDLTRPCPSEVLLPPVLAELNDGGVGDADITVVIALGLHRPMTAAERKQAVGPEVFRRVRVLNHDPADTVPVGMTSRGTPVEVFRPVVEADMRVCLGNVEFHYFAGFSGGAKAVLPGCASEATITANHAMMVRVEAAAGRIEGNPLREDLEEGVALVGVDFLLNVLLDAEHRVVAAFAGDVTTAHRRACARVRECGAVALPAPADIVVVGAGGHPTDMDLYQAQKALANAARVIRDGGIVIWVARCEEGLGNPVFESWLRSARSPADVLRRIQERFILGGHKAAAVASVLQRARIHLVTQIDAGTVRACGMVPFADVGSALKEAIVQLGPSAHVLAMPRGGSTYPEIVA